MSHVEVELRSEEAAPSVWLRGRSLRVSGQLAEAERILRQGAAADQDDVRWHDELGTTLMELGRHEEAIGAFLAILRLQPDHDEACNKIGSAFSARGMFQPAVTWFHRGRLINPAGTKYLSAYGRALVAVGCVKLATEIFAEWVRAEPANPIARHLSSAALGEEAATAPRDYVRALFDEFAAEFDDSLRRLNYCGPDLILGSLKRVVDTASPDWEVLDAGCGTGLVGTRLRPLARHLVGVDVSAGMLEAARARHLYDELIEADMIDFLKTQNSRFDVLTAADVLTYVGDLNEFFRWGAQALRPGGIVVVALEALSGAAAMYRLNPTGRFSHRPNYVRGVMESAGFQLAELREDAMRQEGRRPVPTLVATGIRMASAPA